jgi:LCP family protein required for cell wall assembly
VLAVFLVLVGVVAYVLMERRSTVLRLLVQPRWLTITVVALSVAFMAWALVVLFSDLLSRPRALGTGQRIAATTFTVLLCLVLAAPFVLAVRYAEAQRTFIDDVFVSAADSRSPTRPVVRDPEEDPWHGQDRVNILLLGGDAGPNRTGTRTDSMIVASIDVSTGDAVLFGLPRNLEDVPFPRGTRLHELYPAGFTGPGDPLEWMLNAVYPRIPELHPKVLGNSDNEGADALKLAVSGALGIPVDYYVLVSIPGFIELVDAIGGVTVNINQPIPIGGVTGVREPDGYLKPGPNQRLNGYQALWFARGRYGLDDYDRMRRQRCLLDAVIEKAAPYTLLSRYERILDAGRNILRTDVPGELLPAFVDLAFEVKDAKIKSVVFARSDNFVPEAANFDWMHRVVDRAIGGGGGGKGGGKGGGRGGGKGGGLSSVIDSPGSTCDYQPVR